MTVIKQIIADAQTGKLSAADKIMIALLALLLILAFIFFGVIFTKVKTDKNAQVKEQIDALESANKEKDKYILSLQNNLAEKDKRIGVYMQMDSALQKIATNNIYLLTKLNEKDAQISHHINSPSFTTDSLLKAINDNY